MRIVATIIIVCFFLSSDRVASQNKSALDSLNTLIKAADHDSIKARLLLELAYEVKLYNSDSAILICNESIRLLEKAEKNDPLKNTLLKVKGAVINLKGLVYRNIGELEKSLQYLNESVKIYASINDEKGVAEAMVEIGSWHYYKGELRRALEVYRSCLKVLKEHDAMETVGTLLSNIGVLHYNLGNMDSAFSCFEKALEIHENGSDLEQIALVSNNLASIYYGQGLVGKALNGFHKSLSAREKIGDKKGIAQSLSNIATIYQAQKESKKALDYLQKSLVIRREIKDKPGEAVSLVNIGAAYSADNRTDSALFYYQQGLDIYEALGDKGGIAMSSEHIASQHIGLKNYSEAEESLKRSLELHKEQGNKTGIETCLHWYANMAYKRKELGLAEKYGKESMALSNELGLPFNISRSSELLSEIHAALGHYKEAYTMHVLYKQMADSINNEENQKAVVKKQMQYEFEKKEAIAQAEQEKKDAIQQQELEKRDAQIKMYASMSGVLVLIFIGAFLYFRNRKKTEKLALEKKLVELEQKALSLQMNPHFIFNALNSISGFISDNDSISAKKYLAKFAKLMRLILEGSNQPSESIQKEAELLENYLQLEQLRFNNKFEFNIEIDEQLDPESASIPPMLLQPQVENALLHGIMNKEQGGKIDIRFLSRNNKLVCEIEDNGVGRQMAKEMNSTLNKHKSMATSITQERIAIMNKKEEQHINYIIEDLLDETNVSKGTKVILEFPFTFVNDDIRSNN